MKKFLGVFFVVLLALVITISTAIRADKSRDATYNDVEGSDWFHDSVYCVTKAGLMRGVGNDQFAPNREITMAEVYTLAARIHSILYNDTPAMADSYGDGTEWNWWEPYVRYCADHGILTGLQGDMTRTASRLECAGLISRAAPGKALTDINAVVENAIPDLPYRLDEYAPAVYQLYRAGVLTGYDTAGFFQPDCRIKRCEVAAIVARLIDPSLRRTVSGMTHTPEEEKDAILSTDDAKKILRKALIQAYENTYGTFSPLEAKPDSAVLDREYLRWAIPHLEEPAETQHGYLFTVVFPFFVDRYSGVVCKIYNGENPTMTIFDPFAPYALGFAG